MLSNEILWLILIPVIFFGIIIVYKFFGRAGLYAWTAMSVIIANIQVLKTIQLFGFVTAEGNIIYGSTFLVTDILCEKYDKKDARKAVWIGFAVLIAVAVIMQITLLFQPDASDLMHPALQQVFGFFPRIVISSLTAYLISQNFDVWFYAKIREWTKGKHMWLRNNLGTMTAQLIDNVIFTWMAFIGFGAFWEQVLPWDVVIQIFISSYILKWLVAVFDTPFLYWAKRITPKSD